MSQWKVVGGAGKGGIVVRAGRDLKAAELAERLATDAVVEELALVGERLQYQKLSGSGPATGWVSTKLKDKDLVVREVAPQAPVASVDLAPQAAIPPGSPLDGESEDLQKLLASPSPADSCRLPATYDFECSKESSWTTVTEEQVIENHMKRAPGMFYGLDFPWTEPMLLSFGPEWLTKAFHAAGTLSLENRVTAIKNVKEFVLGNNGSKTFFDVDYLRPSPDLHTHLFAKYPFLMDPETRSDRLASSVRKQPQDLHEVNAYRLLEGKLPVRMPKYYFADINNDTTNFILILERVHFADPECTRELAPLELEGPYDKCMDWTLRSEPSQYYYALFRAGAKMAGAHKAGRLADQATLGRCFDNTASWTPKMYGCGPASSGDPFFEAKLSVGEEFVLSVANMIFPQELADPEFLNRWRKVLRTANAYSGESNWWRHSRDEDYISFTHNNLNVDNAYFFRTEDGALDLGIFDWANFGAKSLGFKLYWWLYTAEFEMIKEHFEGLLDCFVATYRESGGPQIDKEALRVMVLLSAAEQGCELIKAVPQIYRMCPKSEWAAVTGRRDPRIFDNVHGKSTLRLYLHCLVNITKMIFEYKLDEVLDGWVDEVCDHLRFAPKDV